MVNGVRFVIRVNIHFKLVLFLKHSLTYTNSVRKIILTNFLFIFASFCEHIQRTEQTVKNGENVCPHLNRFETTALSCPWDDFLICKPHSPKIYIYSLEYCILERKWVKEHWSNHRKCLCHWKPKAENNERTISIKSTVCMEPTTQKELLLQKRIFVFIFIL